jgi:hypothetical protein
MVDLLTTAKKYADADDAKKLLNEGTDKAPYSPRRDDFHDNYRRDDFRGCSDIGDRRNNNRDRRDKIISMAIAVTTSRASVLTTTTERSTL